MRYNFFKVKTINEKIFMNHKCDVYCRDQNANANKIWNFKSEVLSSEISNIEFLSWKQKNFIFEVTECLIGDALSS